MVTSDYICKHCGHNFEAAESDVLECPKCFWSTSVEKTEASDKRKAAQSIDYENLNAIFRWFIGMGVIVALFLLPGFLTQVVFGKLSTGQYLHKVYADIRKIETEWPLVIRKTMNRITNVSPDPSEDNPASAVAEKEKTPLERVMEEARANLKLPEFTELPSMRGATEEEKDFLTSPYYFTFDMVEALKFIWDGDKLHKELNEKSDEEINDKMYQVFIEKIRLLHSAVNVIKPYAKSSDELISSAAKGALLVLMQQLNYNFDTLAFLKYINTYLPESQKDVNEAYKVLQEMQYEVRRIREEYDGTYRQLLSVIILTTHALVSRTPDENGHMSLLGITAIEKARLIQHMQKNFGDIPPLEAGLSLSESPIAALYQFLTTSEHKPRAESGNVAT